MSDSSWAVTPPPSATCVDRNGTPIVVGTGIRLLYTESGHIPGIKLTGCVSARIIKGFVSKIEYTRNVFDEEYWTLEYFANDEKAGRITGRYLLAKDCEVALDKPTTLWGTADDRERIAAWIRSNPSKDIPCHEHDHGPRHKCFVSVPMTVEEIADAIVRGDYP